MWAPTPKKVSKIYNELLINYGPELKILHERQLTALVHQDVPLLGEAIRRVRKKEVQIFPGYDGEFGKIKLFTPQEKERLSGHI